MAHSQTGLTYRDLLEMFPEEDNRRRELVGGDLIVPPAPSTRHQKIVMWLGTELSLFARDEGGTVFGAPTDVFFTDVDVAQPDILYIRREHLDRVERPFVRGAPDLVVEVSSPSTREADLQAKRRLYERHGVPEYWFVDLELDRVQVYRLAEGRYGPPLVLGRGEALGSPLLPGFGLSVGDLLGPMRG